MNPGRLIIDEPQTGSWNMAVDEYLLLSAAEQNFPTLRLYRWSEPTLSLGYFQRLGDRQQHEASCDCVCVRRRSGGGAILHDHELTYSLTMPNTERWAAQADSLYNVIHNALCQLYKSWGAAAELSTIENGDAFLCFQRRAAGDILIGDHKVTGSAQRRHKSVTLQHGSILIHSSAAAPELPGIEDLIDAALPIDQLVRDCKVCLTQALGCDLKEQSLNANEKSEIQAIERNKFATADWLARR